jgi:hypothetical protein
VSSEIVPTTTYSCPRCHVELDTPSGRWEGWLRCPSCGRASLPPEPERLLHISRGVVVSGRDNGAPLEVGLPTGAMGLDIPRPGTGRMAHTSVARLVFTTGFVLCLLLTLIYFLDFNAGRLAIFGLLTIGFFLLLLRTPRKRLRLELAPRVRSELDSTTRDKA